MKQGRHYLLIFAMLLCSTTGHCDEIITFADDLVRLICVTQWDTNTDGDLSKDEAAVVTSLGTVFKETAIVSFDELQYFKGLSSIATNAFQMCTSLESIVIPANVTQIGNGAFNGCTSLESVLLPDSLTSIGSSAFEECIGLKAIYEYSPVPVQLVTGIHTRAESVVSQFAEVDMETCVLYIPVGSKTAYMQAEGWKEFKNIVEMGETCDLTIGKNGKTTFCGDKALDFSYSDEVKAFIATGFDKTEGTIWMTRVKDVPAGVPVMIKGTANETYHVPVTEGGSSYYKNMFVGNTSGEIMSIGETSEDGQYVNYYMSGGQFKSVNTSANIGANKCYLQLPATFAAEATGEGYQVKIAASGKSSFAAPYDLDFTSLNDDVKAFTATGYDASTKTIWLNSRRSPCRSSSAASAATMKPRGSRTITVKQ